MKMPSKSGGLDILTTSLLKRALDSCLPVIARVVNLSLDKGEFCTYWNTAVVKPLIKSSQKGNVKSNYRPVSKSLHLFSMLWEIVYWTNSQNTVMIIHYCPSANQHIRNFTVMKEVY